MTAADGLLVIDKPAGMTSRAAVNHFQRLLPRKTRIGHAGTLDPAATGVLVVCVGAATRLVEYVQGMEKVYSAEFTLGAVSSTDDADGEIRQSADVSPPSRCQLESALRRFIGTIRQIPPQFSAAKVRGKRAYRAARSGETVNLPPRQIHISAIEVIDYAFPAIWLTIRCGKGTYIRSLARDLGAVLGCGGYVRSLRRTRIGVFEQNQAVTMNDEFDPEKHLLPLDRAVADMLAIEIAGDGAALVGNGQALTVSPPVAAEADIALKCDGRLLAVGRSSADGGSIKPVKVLVKTPSEFAPAQTRRRRSSKSPQCRR